MGRVGYRRGVCAGLVVAACLVAGCQSATDKRRLAQFLGGKEQDVAAQATEMNVQFNLGNPESDRRKLYYGSSATRSPLHGPTRPDRIVTLASLSQRIADGFFALSLAH